ncbi:3-hydroxybenzoate 6-hydroxylase 1 [Termitomyces sp. T112]|nr:3-hydroxybenzoate 6-hydroxylase 1 [Termitomyces sp. T112]
MSPVTTQKSPVSTMRHEGAPCKLDITIVGAGIGGLAVAYCLGRAGHKVTVLEAASFLNEAGAGIQCTPNVTRLLIRWGLGEELKKIAVVPQSLSLRRYWDGERVGWNKWGDDVEREHGAPYYHVHRADLHRLLQERAAPYMALRLKSKVLTVEASTPFVVLESGEIIKTDLVIGADGVRSVVRDIVVGRKDAPLKTGDAAYRATIPTAEIVKDPVLKPFVDDAEANVWMGPGRHIVGYCIRAKKEYNLVMIHPSNGEGEVPVPTDCEQMRADYADFEPRVRKLLDLVPSTMSWALCDHNPLDSWVHPSSKICLLGDACHPMLPYRAQGAAMAIEDAAVLGNLFTHLASHAQIPTLLRAYQKMRHPRASVTQLASRMNQSVFHLPDGPAQDERDREMKDAMQAELVRVQLRRRGMGSEEEGKGNKNVWADREKVKALYEYDPDVEVEMWRRSEDARVVQMAKL